MPLFLGRHLADSRFDPAQFIDNADEDGPGALECALAGFYDAGKRRFPNGNSSATGVPAQESVCASRAESALDMRLSRGNADEARSRQQMRLVHALGVEGVVVRRSPGKVSSLRRSNHPAIRRAAAKRYRREGKRQCGEEL